MAALRLKHWILVAATLGIAWSMLSAHAIRTAPRHVAASPGWLLPSLSSTIILDGKLQEPAWQQAARTGAFSATDGKPAPHAEARLAVNGSDLLVALYAADTNIENRNASTDGAIWLGDHFQLLFQKGTQLVLVDVAPTGAITDARRRGDTPFDFAWQSGAKVATDVDGTVNDSRDEDEEWAVELRIPLAAVNLDEESNSPTHLTLQHCDVPAANARRCTRFLLGNLSIAKPHLPVSTRGAG